MRLPSFLPLILLAWFSLVPAVFGAESAKPLFTGGLAWKSLTNSYTAKVGETGVDLVFWFTNRTSNPVTIYRIEPSCGCTVAEKPRDPWIIEPGAADKLEVKVDFKGKYGSLHKGILVDASSGTAMLAVDVEIPENPDDKIQNRANNLIMALSNRQAVFQGDCVRCHVKPGMGKTGKELYVAVCGVCHEGEHRASMVPELKSLKTPTNPAYWRQWIAQGREGSLMPAFDEKQGGPLNEIQIRSLIDYLEQDYKRPSPHKTPTAK